MVARQPLTGIILVDCAKANAAQGLKVAARQCGYGSDLNPNFLPQTSTMLTMAIALKGCKWKLKTWVEASPLADQQPMEDPLACILKWEKEVYLRLVFPN